MLSISTSTTFLPAKMPVISLSWWGARSSNHVSASLARLSIWLWYMGVRGKRLCSQMSFTVV